MTCEDMQMKIWSGQVDAAVKEHIQTCVDCRREHTEVQTVLGGIQALDGKEPQPTRSLQPSNDLIRRTVRKNRLRRRWTSSSVAAGVAILLGTGVGLGLHQMGDSVGNSKSSQEMSLGSAPPETMKRATKSSTYIASTPPINAPYDTADTYKADSDYAVMVDDTATAPELCQKVAEFLQQSQLMGVQRITILHAQEQGTEGAMKVALVTLDITLRPGGVSLYKQGIQQAQIEYQQVEGTLQITRFAPVQEKK